MCEVLDKIVARGEARGEFNILYKQIKKGILTIEQAAKSADLTINKLLEGFEK